MGGHNFSSRNVDVSRLQEAESKGAGTLGNACSVIQNACTTCALCNRQILKNMAALAGTGKIDPLILDPNSAVASQSVLPGEKFES